MTNSTLDEAAADAIRQLAQVAKLLSDETRLRILFLLQRNGSLHVTALCKCLSQSQPAVSHHLALMRVAGLIESKRNGKHNYYSLCVPFLSNLVRRTIASRGSVPRRLALHDFILSYNARRGMNRER